MKYIGDIVYGGRKMAWGKGAVANSAVYLSGVEGIDSTADKCPPDIEAQTTTTLRKVKSRLEEAGTDINHIVKFVAYVVGRENLDGYRSATESWRKESGVPTPPTFASTLVLVAGLARPDMLVEVDVIASLPQRD